MNDIISSDAKIENMIYEIRGKQVMLDSDLAKLYQCANGTKDINKAVKRNMDRFPEDFYFELTNDECLRFQIGTLNSKGDRRGQHLKYLPHVFTEQGVAMLSSVLKTEVAAQVSISIMRAFVAMRHYISDNLIEQKIINNIVLENQKDIKVMKQDISLLQISFKQFEEKKVINEVYFDGQIFDAYSKINDIFDETHDNLVIIDSYADIKLLNIIKKLNFNVIIITSNNSTLTEQDISEYNKQYNNLRVIYNNTYHDRYFIIDNKKVYHCGASINRIGYKTFSINLLNDKEVIIPFINNINAIK